MIFIQSFNHAIVLIKILLNPKNSLEMNLLPKADHKIELTSVVFPTWRGP